MASPRSGFIWSLSVTTGIGRFLIASLGGGAIGRGSLGEDFREKLA